jgi:hypothetical protein
VALVEVDVIGAEACERLIDLLQHLPAREPVVLAAVVHREVPLRREHVRVARAGLQHLAEERLCLAERVHIRGVDEVDARGEGGIDAGSRLVVADAPTVREPGAEADFGHLELAVSDPPVPRGNDRSKNGTRAVGASEYRPQS